MLPKLVVINSNRNLFLNLDKVSDLSEPNHVLSAVITS